MTRFNVIGMCCAEETTLLRKVVGEHLGASDLLRFDLLRGEMIIDTELTEKQVEEIKRVVKTTGMSAKAIDEGGRIVDDSGLRPKRNPFFVSTIVSGLFVALGFASSVIPVTADTIASKVAYSIAILAGLRLVLPRSWVAIKSIRPDMNLLMTLAVAGALIIDEWFEAAVIAFLFALSLLLELWSVSRARNAVESLLESTPERARRVVDDGEFEEVEPADILIGDLLFAKPGEKIPVDGRVASGTSNVDQATVTGENIPVKKKFGDPLYAGTINLNGAIEFVATRPASESTFARILHLVEDAGSRRSRSEQWVERFALIYTPAIMLCALLVMVIPPFIFAESWTEWFYRGLVILVIGCPCALVISTPVSIVAGLAAAARNGVLIKGGEYLEIPARLRVVAFDKTGTLTQGRPGVTEVIPLNGHNEHELIERAATLEANSTHPLARAVLDYADHLGVSPMKAEGFQTLEGKGASAEFNGKRYRLGSRAFLDEWNNTTTEVQQRADMLVNSGRSVVAIGSDNHVCGLIGVIDPVRSETPKTITDLQDMGVETVMLTGDNRQTASVIAQETGVSQVYSELLPEDKVSCIEELARSRERVAMVGDGVNDAPAMARSSLGIAMGAAGTDVALETADVVLMSDDLSRVTWLIQHSRRALNIIRWNVGFALGIKFLFFGATLFGVAALWGAIAADIGATLAVTANALRLLRG